MGNILLDGVPIETNTLQPSIKSGTKTVTTAGTALKFTALAIPEKHHVLIKALNGNTDAVHISDTKARAEADATAFELQPNDTLELAITNMDKLWIDANVNGEGVTFVVETDA